MKDYSLEIINKNITQNNIEKIKSSIQRLKDTINRSNSNNYRNLKINSQKYYHNNIHNRVKVNAKKENESVMHYNLKESVLNNDIYSPNKNIYINLKSSHVPYFLTKNQNLKVNNNQYIINKSFNGFNIQKISNNKLKYSSPYVPSRNKNSIDLNNKTDIVFNNQNEKIHEDTPKLTDYNNDNFNEENSFLEQIETNKMKENFIEKLVRNKSAKQIKVNDDKINNNMNNKEVLHTSQNSSSNTDIFEQNNIKNNFHYKNYLSNQINLFNSINKGLLMRYNDIVKKYKSANEQNNILINKINELKAKEKKIKNNNIILEKEFTVIKNKLNSMNKDNKNNDNKFLIIQKNKELNDKIDKYDEIILELKKKINILIKDKEIKKI